ncbi:response regulator [Halioglobus japonicus]|uniref:Response regulator n=1 Tax=Halioglobus japonicus TaxID=930805 RepID=A0AAP8ME48_9GAMM|nr:response regulator [Halioglobus japonicus]PLW86127.1 response regulator [Halioglobus japonicus]GHD14338.1 response regulator [Halioglobus japonicus]
MSSQSHNLSPFNRSISRIDGQSDDSTRASGSISILLIEDNPGDIELTREALLETGRLTNQLDVITDGETALDYLLQREPHSSTNLPDLILLDLNLPKVSGREILAQVKADENLRCIPIIVLSSSEASRDIQETYQLHANCFITKPVQLQDFLNVIQMIETFWINIVALPRADQPATPNFQESEV